MVGSIPKFAAAQIGPLALRCKSFTRERKNGNEKSVRPTALFQMSMWLSRQKGLADRKCLPIFLSPAEKNSKHLGPCQFWGSHHHHAVTTARIYPHVLGPLPLVIAQPDLRSPVFSSPAKHSRQKGGTERGNCRARARKSPQKPCCGFLSRI
jgi:hypothetical protein